MTSGTVHNTPGARLSRWATLRRGVAGGSGTYGWPLVGVLAALAIVAPVVEISGVSWIQAYKTLFDASFGSSSGFGALLQFSVPEILVGLGVALPLRAGLFNVGGEGQLLVGALAAVAVGVKFPAAAGSPVSAAIPLFAAAIAGALLGLVAGALKAWRGINEIISTIMLNFVAMLFVQYWVAGSFKDPMLTYPASPLINPGYTLGHLGTVAQIPVSFFVALGIALFVALAVHYTRAGWRLRLTGISPELAARQGVSVPRLYVFAFVWGGALAGVGGGAEAIGNQLRIGENFSPGWGFDAVVVAILARGNMLAVVPYALFLGFLRNGSGLLQTNLGLSGSIVTVLIGAPVIIVAAIIGFRAYRRMLQTN